MSFLLFNAKIFYSASAFDSVFFKWEIQNMFPILNYPMFELFYLLFIRCLLAKIVESGPANVLFGKSQITEFPLSILPWGPAMLSQRKFSGDHPKTTGWTISAIVQPLFFASNLNLWWHILFLQPKRTVIQLFCKMFREFIKNDSHKIT